MSGLRQNEQESQPPRRNSAAGGDKQGADIGPTWVDDTCLHFECADACDLSALVREGINVLIDLSEESGFEVNFKEKNTECVMCLRGLGSAQAKHDRGIENGTFTIDLGRPRVLRVVKSYLHLGSMFAMSARAVLEANRRDQAVRGVETCIRKEILGNSNLEIQTKVNIASSLVEARLLSDVGGWTAWSQTALDAMEATRMRSIRGIYRSAMFAGSSEEVPSSARVRHDLNLLPMVTLIRIRRLSYLARYAQHAPAPLKALVEGQSLKQGWRALVCADITWIAAVLPDVFGALPEITDDEQWHTWMASCANNPKQWMLWIRSAGKEALVLQKQQAADDPYDEVQHDSWQCRSCDRCFKSARAVATHERIAHDRRHWVETHVATTFCTICSNEFWSIARLRQHLKTCYKCGMRARLRAWEDPTHAELEAANSAKKKFDKKLRNQGREIDAADLPALHLTRVVTMMSRARRATPPPS